MTYEILERTQHFRRVDGRWYRDCVARRSDGELRLLLVPAKAGR